MEELLKAKGCLIEEKDGVVKATAPSPFTQEERDALIADGYVLKNRVQAVKTKVNLEFDRPVEQACSGIYLGKDVLESIYSYPHIAGSG